MIDINKLIITLSSEKLSREILIECLDDFSKYTKDTQSVNKNYKEYAQIYCLLLKGFTKFHPEIENPKYICKTIFSCFQNIQNITHIEKDRKETTSDLKVIALLKILREVGTTSNKRDIINDYAVPILDILSDIEFIFDIKDENGEYYFPLSNTIQHIISSKRFSNFENGSIGEKDLRLLQLAVRLFKKESEIEKTLDSLKKDCNLKFINYLMSPCVLVDQNTLPNYLKNRVMVFINPDNNQVLIRNDKRDYFSNCNPAQKVQEEKNYKGTPIGFFVEEHLGIGHFSSFEKLLEDEANRIPLLQLLFDKEYKNIFLDKALFKNNKNEIIPVNPYCNKDNYIIYQEKEDKYRIIESLPPDEPRFNLYTIRNNDSNSEFDRITFGLCWFLLTQNNISTQQLFTPKSDNDWYQNIVLNNWIESPRVNMEAIKHLINKVIKELSDSCKRGELSKKQIISQCFLPLDGNLANTIICKKYKGNKDCNYQVLKVTINSDYDETTESTFSVCGDNVSITKELIKDDSLELETIKNSETAYVVKMENPSGYFFDQQNYLESLHSVQCIQKNSLPYNLFIKEGKGLFDILYEKMNLFDAGFLAFEITQDYPCLKDKQEQYFIRILYNLVWLGIKNRSEVLTYYNIIKKHQNISFDKNKAGVKTTLGKVKDGTLIIPKDKWTSDSVLYSANGKYYKLQAYRDGYNLFDNEIDLNNGKYTIHNKIIKEIIFLTDNSLHGSATIKEFRKRLNTQTSDITVKDRGNITIKEILEQNQINRITVCCIYGTEKAKDNIIKALKEDNIQCEVNIITKIENYCLDEETVEDCKTLFDKTKEYTNFIPVFREFSMPKLCVFPGAMLDDPKHAICLFIRKKELKPRR